MLRLAVATILVANLLAVVLAWLARCPDLSAHEAADYDPDWLSFYDSTGNPPSETWGTYYEREWADIERRLAE